MTGRKEDLDHDRVESGCDESYSHNAHSKNAC